MDVLARELEDSTIQQVLVPRCVVASCGDKASALVSLGFKDGTWRMYGVCSVDLAKVKERFPANFVRDTEQSQFFF